jgi:hypothetical protein
MQIGQAEHLPVPVRVLSRPHGAAERRSCEEGRGKAIGAFFAAAHRGLAIPAVGVGVAAGSSGTPRTVGVVDPDRRPVPCPPGWHLTER